MSSGYDLPAFTSYQAIDTPIKNLMPRYDVIISSSDETVESSISFMYLSDVKSFLFDLDEIWHNDKYFHICVMCYTRTKDGEWISDMVICNY